MEAATSVGATRSPQAVVTSKAPLGGLGEQDRGRRHGEGASWNQGTLQSLIALGQRGIVLLHDQTHAE